LKNLSRESKEDLKKALEEMEGYSNLLVAFEQKIKMQKNRNFKLKKKKMKQ